MMKATATEGGGARRSFPALGRAAAVLALLAIASFAPTVGLSQEEAQPISITKLISEDFPLVGVQLAAWEASDGPIILIPNENLRVSEDDVPHQVLSVEPVDVGVRLAFVIDPGDGVRNTGASLRTVYSLANEYLQTFFIGRPWMLSEVDEATILVQEGESTHLLSPMSSDAELLAQQLNAYTPPSDAAVGGPAQAGDFTRTGLRRALDELQFAPGGEDKPQALVLFTPGMRADTSDLASRAIEAGIPIHIVMAREDRTKFWEEALKPLADITGGAFETHYDSGDLEPLFQTLTEKRQQLRVTYRSTSAAAGQRLVTIEIDTTSETLSAMGQYNVSLQPPALELITPAPGTLINRQEQEGSESPEDAEPTFITIVAEVTWPDGYPRQLGPAQLLVDGHQVSQGQIVEGKTEITWDLRAYQESGQTPATLQVVVDDELGLHGESQPRNVSVQYVRFPGSDPGQIVLLYVALGVALLSLGVAVFLFINRERLAPALQQAGDSVMDFVERVTGRRTALVAKAYLVPLEGFEELPRRSFEVYGTTAIGRSRRHADLLFHVTDDDSAISRLHCTILDEDDHFAIRDEDSTNGTLVNGERITPLEPLRLHDGDTIDVAPIERGGLRFLFQLADVVGDQPEVAEESRQTKPRRISDFGPPSDRP